MTPSSLPAWDRLAGPVSLAWTSRPSSLSGPGRIPHQRALQRPERRAVGGVAGSAEPPGGAVIGRLRRKGAWGGGGEAELRGDVTPAGAGLGGAACDARPRRSWGLMGKVLAGAGGACGTAAAAREAAGAGQSGSGRRVGTQRR